MGKTMAGSGELREVGKVVAIAYRPTDGETMRELSECVVAEKRGLELENRKHGRREITLLSQEAWNVVCNELGVELHWHTRRANLLVTGIDLPACIGHAVAVGGVRVWIHRETGPCHLMEDQHAGLREALKPNGRGGVHGQVLSGGSIRIGDSITLDQSAGYEEVKPSSGAVAASSP